MIPTRPREKSLCCISQKSAIIYHVTWLYSWEFTTSMKSFPDMIPTRPREKSLCRISQKSARIYYGVATISRRLLKIIGFFCKTALYWKWYSAKENYNFKELTDRSHPIAENLQFLRSHFQRWFQHDHARKVFVKFLKKQKAAIYSIYCVKWLYSWEFLQSHFQKRVKTTMRVKVFVEFLQSQLYTERTT